MSNREYVKYQGIKFFFHPFSKYYLASKSGQILSLKWNKRRILKLNNNCWGYLVFNFYENNKKRQYFVHRFVYECFKGTIPKGMHTDHCDNNKENNSISNLQLLTPSENIRKSHFKIKVKSLNIETKEEKIFDSLKDAGEFYQIDFSNISKNCRKKINTLKSKKNGKRYQFSYL